MSNPQQDNESSAVWVWLVRPCETLIRMTEMILVETGEGEGELYALGQWSPRNLVEHVLSVTSFTGGDPNAGTGAQQVSLEDVDVVKLVGFAIDGGNAGAVMEAIDRGMREGPGGFSSVLLAQAGFHASPYVFKLAWEAAGMPAVKVTHPELTHGESDKGGPPPIPFFGDRSLKLSLLRRGIDLALRKR